MWQFLNARQFLQTALELEIDNEIYFRYEAGKTMTSIY